MIRGTVARALGAGVLAGVAAVSVGAEQLSALGQVRPGGWLIHEIGAKDPPRALCVSDPHRLLQIEHGAAACNFQTIANEGSAATVRYVCPGAGTGTTELTVESPSIVRLHTQGVHGGAPFDTTYEARFSGPCRGA